MYQVGEIYEVTDDLDDHFGNTLVAPFHALVENNHWQDSEACHITTSNGESTSVVGWEFYGCAKLITDPVELAKLKLLF
jgi:hypothetical protein